MLRSFKSIVPSRCTTNRNRNSCSSQDALLQNWKNEQDSDRSAASSSKKLLSNPHPNPVPLGHDPTIISPKSPEQCRWLTQGPLTQFPMNMLYPARYRTVVFSIDCGNGRMINAMTDLFRSVCCNPDLLPLLQSIQITYHNTPYSFFFIQDHLGALPKQVTHITLSFTHSSSTLKRGMEREFIQYLWNHYASQNVPVPDFIFQGNAFSSFVAFSQPVNSASRKWYLSEVSASRCQWKARGITGDK